MIFEPQPYFNVNLAVGLAFINALARFAADYVIQDNQSWEYYIGYGFGGAALASSIPGAQAILYTIGAGTVSVFFEKSPGAANARLFLDGVAQADITLDDEIIDIVEYLFNVPNDGLEHSIAIVNLGTDPSSLNEPNNWLSILAIESPNEPFIRESSMADVFLISMTVRDAKTIATARKKNKMACSLFFPIGALTLANIIAKHDAVVAAVDGVTGCVVEASSITLFPVLPAGLKGAAEAASDVQEGALLSFDLTGTNYTDSVFIPGVKQALVGADGQSIILTDGLVTALTNIITVEGGATSPASNKFGLTYNDVAAGEKVFRK